MKEDEDDTQEIKKEITEDRRSREQIKKKEVENNNLIIY